MNLKDVSVYVGRFNPFHLGHAHVLERALRTSKLVVVLVGSSYKARTPKNPFSYEERKEMIEQWFRNYLTFGEGHCGELEIRPMRDFASNNKWIASVQSTVKSVITAHCTRNSTILTDIYITGSDRDDSTWYLEAFPQWKKDLVPALQHKPGTDEDLSATSVRKVLYESDLTAADMQSISKKLPPSTLRFIANFARAQEKELQDLRTYHSFVQKGKKAWEPAPYAPTFQTADACIIQSGHVLLIRRGNQPGFGLWAFPGGYVNQSERVRAAAVREAEEETGIRLTTGKNAKEITLKMLDGSIRDKEFFDDPGRSERGRIFTMAYLIRLDDTKPLPKVSGMNVPYYESDGKEMVETLDAVWMPLAQAAELGPQWFEDHGQILDHFMAVMDG